MRLLPPRLVLPVAVVVLGWGALHLMSDPRAVPAPAAWPVPTGASPSMGALLPAAPGATAPPAAPSASGDPGIPVLPGALRQLNQDTRDTAVGLYAIVQQIESALGSDLGLLAQQLEPGR
jgi:hypothetical protein